MARRDLILSHLWMVDMIAARLSGRGVAFEDLVSMGRVALIKEAKNYRPERWFTFADQAEYPIRRAMCKAFVRKKGWVRGEPARFISLDEELPAHERGTTLKDMLQGNSTDDPDRIADRADLMRVLDTLPARERRMLREYCGLETGQSMTMKDIGHRWGVSDAAVLVVIKRAAAQMKARLTQGA